VRGTLRSLSTIAGTTILAGCALLGIRSGYEQPPYQVLGRLGEHVEIRRYGPRLAAETEVEAASEEAGRDAAFRILAAYLFGENRAGENVSMTAPVEIQQPATRVAMTAPVETTASAGRVAMRFFMPSRFTRETLPEPTDPRVRIAEVPGETLAVLRFSGSRRAAAVSARSDELRRVLDGSSWQGRGDPKALFYDPPWTLPFLRRNEVAVPVEPIAGARTGTERGEGLQASPGLPVM
jgi:hypothetical protein